MESSIKVQVYDRELKAAVKELPPGCSIDTIRQALEREKITNGIQWEAINDAVSTANATGLTLTNITVAVAEQPAVSINYGKTGPEFSGEEAETSMNNLTSVGKAIRTGNTSMALADGVFVKADEIAVTVRTSERIKNVYGEEIIATGIDAKYPYEQCLAQKPLPDGFQFIAKSTGYLIINESGAWDVIDPFFASDDRLTLYCRIVPLICGLETFIEKLTRTVPTAEADINDIQNMMVYPHLQNIEVRKGRPPVAGRPGSITFFIE